jgi:ABC-2 type transport system ATP-binding protein
VILSTHLLHDVTACCQRVAILHRGRLRHDGALADLAADDADGSLEKVFFRIASADDAQAAA